MINQFYTSSETKQPSNVILSVENKQVYSTAIRGSFTEFRVIHSNEDKTPFTS